MTNGLRMTFLHWFLAFAPKRILVIGSNYLVWAWKFFSIGYFVPRLFAAWHKDITGYGRGFDLKRFLHVWGWNTISRVIGAILRLVVMACGLVVEICIVLVSGLVVLFWFVLPLMIAGLLILGILTLLVL